MTQFLFTHTLLLTMAQSRPVGTPWIVLIILILLILLLLWWGLTRPSVKVEPETAHHDHHEATATAVSADVAELAPETAVIQPEPAEPDDLKRIEGVGPVIEKLLNQAGITTFAQLAAAEIAALEKIVREDAGITIAFPETWPEQASLAAAGDWETLDRLQDELKGGRRV